MVPFLLGIIVLLVILLILGRSSKEKYSEYNRIPLLIAGTARNIADSWDRTQESLEILISAVSDYSCVIVESNSQDNTLALLLEWASKDPERRHILSLGDLTEPERTKRLALCRNMYMDFFWSRGDFDRFPLLLVVDLDNLELENSFHKQLSACIARWDEWEAVASNRDGPYYDIWALRCRQLGCTFDCWERVRNDPEGTEESRIQKYVRKFETPIPRNRPWIPCESAFGGLALYKTASVKNRVYDGDDICEHVPFHDGLVMFIVPSLISGGPRRD